MVIRHPFDKIGHQLPAMNGSVFKTGARVTSLSCLPSKSNGSSGGGGFDGYRMPPTLKSCEAHPSESIRRQPNPWKKTKG